MPLKLRDGSQYLICVFRHTVPSKTRTILILVFHYTHIRPVVNSYGWLPLKKLTKKLDMPNCICYSYSINCAFPKHRLSQEG